MNHHIVGETMVRVSLRDHGAMLVVVGAAAFTILPPLLLMLGVAFVPVPLGVTFVVFQAAVIAASKAALAALSTRDWARGIAWTVAVCGFSILAFVTLTYCPS
jgi:hypothetical protein